MCSVSVVIYWSKQIKEKWSKEKGKQNIVELLHIRNYYISVTNCDLYRNIDRFPNWKLMRHADSVHLKL